MPTITPQAASTATSNTTEPRESASSGISAELSAAPLPTLRPADRFRASIVVADWSAASGFDRVSCLANFALRDGGTKPVLVTCDPKNDRVSFDFQVPADVKSGSQYSVRFDFLRASDGTAFFTESLGPGPIA